MDKEKIEKILKEKYNAQYIGRHDNLYSSYVIGMSISNGIMKKHYYIINEENIEEIIDEKVLKELKRIYEPKDKKIY